jgi:cysteine desulfurase
MPDIYLDHNATTSLEKEVILAMNEVMGEPLNPSSVHKAGQSARSIIQAARVKIARFIEADDKYNIVFTSSGTEANNLAIRGFDGQKIFACSIEHNSVLNACKQKGGVVVPATCEGIIDVAALDNLLSMHKGKSLISVMIANNETGIIQPVKEVMEIAKKHSAVVHIDAVQAVGKIQVSMKDMDADMLTISAHKIGGPQGAAALVLKKNILLNPQITGGAQEQNLRAGTENVPAICGFGKAVEIIKIDSVVEKLRDRLENLIESVAPEAVIVGKDRLRLPNTSYISMPNVPSQTQLIYFDMHNIQVSSGAACSSGKIGASHVLSAMKVDDRIAQTVIRVSLGKNNTDLDIEAFFTAWETLYRGVNRDVNRDVNKYKKAVQ